MNIIYKFPLIPEDDVVNIEMPKGAEVLTVQSQGSQPMIWAMVDKDSPPEVRSFQVIGTGNPFPDLEKNKKRKYINTFQLMGGNLIFHLFEIVTDNQ